MKKKTGIPSVKNKNKIAKKQKAPLRLDSERLLVILVLLKYKSWHRAILA